MTAKKYTKADGSEGTKWVKLGSVVMNDEGRMFGDLDAIPCGSWFDGSIQLFEAEQANNQTQKHNNNQQNSNQHQNNNQYQGYNQQQGY